MARSVLKRTVATTRDGRDLAVSDVVSEALRSGAPIETAARLAGLAPRELTRLLSDGSRLADLVAMGQKRLSDLSSGDRTLLRFARTCSEALATAEQRLLQQLNRAVFVGDTPTRKTVERFDGNGSLIERRVSEEPTPVDTKAVMWLLERRFNEHWAPTSHQTIDVTIKEDAVRSQRDALLGDLERMATAMKSRDALVEAREHPTDDVTVEAEIVT